MQRHGWLALACILAGATITAAQEKPVLPQGAVARLGMSRLRLPGMLDTAFSPDGRTFVITFRATKEDPGQIRVHRCLVLLERIGTPEARKLLMKLSGGAPSAWLTTEARYSLNRFADQKPKGGQ